MPLNWPLEYFCLPHYFSPARISDLTPGRKTATTAGTMNAKLTWVCLAGLIVAVVFLFHANHVRDQAVADLHDTQQQLHEAQTELDALKNSSAGQQASLITYLKSQNESLTAQVNALKKNLEQLQAQSQQTAEHLTKARTALEFQQQNLQQLQEQQLQTQAAADATTCINNLRQIYAAKAQWALEKQKGPTDVPTVQDLLPYLKDGVFPTCPDGGTYSLNAAGDPPTCSIPGHVLPAQ